MYKVVITNDIDRPKTIIANDEELKVIVTLAFEGGYDIWSVEKINSCDVPVLAKKFINQIQNKIKPLNLVYGVDVKKLKNNYKKDLDKKLKKEKKCQKLK